MGRGRGQEDNYADNISYVGPARGRSQTSTDPVNFVNIVSNNNSININRR
jgi:hypothetical protein